MNKTFVSKSEFRKNLKIAGLFRKHSMRQIQQSGLPCFIFDETNQTGQTFGEKLANAFTTIFDKGFEHVIAVGNDTPGLQSTHISKAQKHLNEQNADIVLGPAPDGGTWLIGFSRKSFNSGEFLTLSWNSPDLLSSIIRMYRQNNSILLLESFGDVDNPEDLLNFLKATSRFESIRDLHRTILLILKFRDELFSNTHVIPLSHIFTTSSLLRAPPVHI